MYGIKPAIDTQLQTFNAGVEGRSIWAINGRFMTQRMTGVQRYAHEIIVSLNESCKDDDVAKRLGFRLVVPPGANARPALSQIDVCQTKVASGHAWDQLVLPWYGPSGVLSLGNFGPVLARRHIVCIHDANTFIQPESYSRAFGLAYRTLLPLIGRRASRVASVSQFSAEMLVKYGICRREKIFIAPNGHEHALRWDAKRAEIPLLKVLKRPYVLLLGSSAKHKNVHVILEQARGLDAVGIDIVVVGATSSIFSAHALDYQGSNIHHVGSVGDDDLAALYEGALCLAFPSKTEGFGIPLLEAMARCCPVISSNAASLIEVGGNAVAYVAPTDGDGWRDAIIGLSRNEGRRASMISEGRKRATLFSWKSSAQIYLAEIMRLIQEVAPHSRAVV
jgi:glycosyltransferase involved in cell wall biosynthesis